MRAIRVAKGVLNKILGKEPAGRRRLKLKKPSYITINPASGEKTIMMPEGSFKKLKNPKPKKTGRIMPVVSVNPRKKNDPFVEFIDRRRIPDSPQKRAAKRE